jgi:hypothetical protein
VTRSKPEGPQFSLRAVLLALVGMLAGSSVTAAEVSVRADSPDTYTVVRGDTLWDIAGQFLEEPWLWPQVWQINPQIENPDLIYPGDVIELVYGANGNPVLRLSRSVESTPGAVDASGIRTIKLTPRVRREAILSPVPAIPLDRISAYLSDNTVVDPAAFESAPYLLGEREGRTLADKGSEVYARGQWTDDVITYDIVRPGNQLVDPDTGAVLGLEAISVGRAAISRYNGSEALMNITDMRQEIRVGDRLIPRDGIQLDSRFMPTPPPFEVDAAIVAIGSGKSIGGNYDTLIMNVGRDDGIDVGHLLTVQEPPVLVEDSLGEQSDWVKTKQVLGFDASHKVEFPGENIATVLVYRVLDNASLGIVLKSDDAIRLNDRLVTP